MKKALMTVLISLSLLGVQPVTAAQLSIRIGPPPQPRVARVVPVRPGPGYTWVEGYWYPQGNRWRWHNGYWTRSPYDGAQWYAPRYQNGEFYQGYWDGSRGRVEHDHHWDRNRNRDYNRFREEQHGDHDRDDRH